VLGGIFGSLLLASSRRGDVSRYVLLVVMRGGGEELPVPEKVVGVIYCS
jgi:hypothetical protein